MQVPLLDLKPQYASIKAEIQEAVQRVVESQFFILGPEVQALEQAVAEYVGVRYAVGCASGSDAIALALAGLGLGPGDEVVCPAYSFFATAGYIVRIGAKPVFADIDSATYNVSAETLARAANECTNLRAIMPVHLFGQAVEAEHVTAAQAAFGVPIVEDAAQAIGSRNAQDQRVGSLGAAGCFSFFPTKNLGGFGDGGMITTNDEALAKKLTSLRMHGSTRTYYHDYVGFNSRLDALQAAVLAVKLKHLDGWTSGRQANASYYDERFFAAGAQTSAVPLDGQPERLPLRTPQPARRGARHIYNQYVIRVPAERREALQAHLKEKGVGTAIYYPLPLHLQPCFAYLGYKKGALPHSERAATETLALPIFPELTEAQLAYTADCIIDFLK
jgi:dTDP-4-amino-4,6-dideoxygalactose transaminase